MCTYSVLSVWSMFNDHVVLSTPCLCNALPYLVSSLVHIENWAIDLSWDIIARFGSNPTYNLPKEFFDDFVQVREHHSYVRVHHR